MPNEPNQVILFFLLVTFLILGLSGFILAILFKYQQKHTAFLNNLEKVKSEHETTLLKSQLEIQETTLNNISKEIHDNIGLSLTLAKLNLNQEIELNNNENVSVAINLLTDAISNLRTLSRTLNSNYVLQNGLSKSLEKEIGYVLNTKNYDVRFEIVGDPFFLDASKELIIFRIAQEALNNAIKHSKATVIETHLIYNDQIIELKIKDNGIGFKYSKSHESFSGLNNIVQRANLLDGNCKIISKEGEGTTIIISIPLQS